MTEGAINKVLYNVDQRGDTTDAEKKTARDNIGALGADDIPEIADDRYKLLQSPLLQTFDSNALIDRLEQNAQGIVTVHCSYLTVATDSSNGLMSASDKAKLDTVEYYAEQNVQSDWNESDPTSDAFIRNKPPVSSQVQSDWAQTDSSAVDFIKNKPDIPDILPSKELVAGSGVTIFEGADRVTISANSQSDNNFTDAYKNKLDGIAAGAEVNVQSDWNVTNTSSDAYIKNKPSVPELSWQQEVQGSTNSFPSDRLKIHQDSHTVTMHTTGGSDVQLGFVVPNPQSSDDGKVLKAINYGAGDMAVVWRDATNADWNATSGAAEILNKPAIPTAGRNMNLNQNNAFQTNLPGGLFDAPASQSNDFQRLDGADFAGAYKLACRHTTSDKYELAISYTASGLSSMISFIGTETVIAIDGSLSIHPAAYIGETVYYTASTRLGGNESTAFDPTLHKAIVYNGIGQIGPTSDCKIAIFKDENGNVKIAFTAIEVGKVGSTT